MHKAGGMATCHASSQCGQWPGALEKQASSFAGSCRDLRRSPGSFRPRRLGNTARIAADTCFLEITRCHFKNAFLQIRLSRHGCGGLPLWALVPSCSVAAFCPPSAQPCLGGMRDGGGGPRHLPSQVPRRVPLRRGHLQPGEQRSAREAVSAGVRAQSPLGS